jgi:hypothetical protein
MQNKLKRMVLFSALSLLTICPAASFAWNSYAYYGDWNYHGSGRDHAYSYYVDNYYSQGDAFMYSMYQPDTVGDELYSNEFTVNIPNDHGGFTAVVIKRSGNGFTGPQGEYYPDFPKVSQLKIMYGK